MAGLLEGLPEDYRARFGRARIGSAGPSWGEVGQTAGDLVRDMTPGFRDLEKLQRGEAVDPQASAWNLLSNLGGGPIAQRAFGAVASGAPSMMTFGGRLSKTADQAALAKAEQAAAAGVPREQIWKDHGWFQGVDKKWRHEIDDSGSTLPYSTSNKEYEGPIRALLKHPELMSAYPKVGEGKGFLTIADHIKEPSGLAFKNGNVVVSASNASDARMTMLHEVQHQVQKHEDFANGSGGRLVRTPEDYARHKAHAGEQEAYAVERRANLTASERRARAPWLDYDVPEANQIVRMPQGIMP